MHPSPSSIFEILGFSHAAQLGPKAATHIMDELAFREPTSLYLKRSARMPNAGPFSALSLLSNGVGDALELGRSAVLPSIQNYIPV